MSDGTRASNSRTFVNDVSGQALQVTQNGNVEHQLIVNGQVLGQYGSVVDPVTPRSTSGSNAGEQQFTSAASFNFGYQPINGNYPTASAGTYTVQAGDTLQSVAQGAYGDSQLWYTIAEANGLSGNSDLRVGQTLTIPNRVGTVHDNAQTVKPYDPSKITGDTTPNMPVPAAKSGCGGLGLILVIVVAIAVTVITAGALLAPAGSSLGTIISTGATALSGGGAVSGVAAASESVSTEAAIGASIVGAAAGSVVSQEVGIALGVQDKFSWKQVALSAIGAGVTSGLGSVPGLAGTGLPNVAARAAISNALTQGIGVVTGLQRSFDWKGVAASAAGAVVGQQVGDSLRTSGIFGAGTLGNLARATVSGLAAGLTTAALRGGRIAITQVAADAFGNALGQGLIESTKGDLSADKKIAQTLVDSTNPLDSSIQQNSALLDKLSTLKSSVSEALASKEAPDPKLFDDEDRQAYEMIISNGNSESAAARLASIMAAAARDPDLQSATSMGSVGGVAGPRPIGVVAAAAYDNALSQMTPLKGAAQAAIDAYEASLLTGIAARVNDVDNYIGQRGIDNVDPSLIASRNVIVAALIDKDVYFDSSIKQILPESVRRLDVIDNNGIQQSGFYGATYSDNVTGKVFVADRGTEFGAASRQDSDMAANRLQLLGLNSNQYSEAINWSRQLRETYGGANLVFTGHSLGGGLASAQAEVVGDAQAITFNSAGLHANTVAPFGASLNSNSNIQAYYIKGELISMLQDGGRIGVRAAELMPSISLSAAYLESRGVGPQAAGTRIELQPVAEPSWKQVSTSFPTSVVETFAEGGVGGTGAIDTGITDALTLHGQSQVVFALLPALRGAERQIYFDRLVQK